jgi:hypothetical protein
MDSEKLTRLMNWVELYQKAVRYHTEQAKESYQTSKTTDIPEYAALQRAKARKEVHTVVWMRRRLKQAKKCLLEALMIEFNITDYVTKEN